MSMATDSSHRVIRGKCCEHASTFIFNRILFILAGNKDIQNISDEFEKRPDRTKDCGVSCPWASGKIPMTYNGRNLVNTLALSFFLSIILILASNEDMHESLDEFKFRPDTATNSRFICPCASEKLMYNVANTQAPLFLIGSSSYWQVRRATITSRTRSKFCQIGPRAAVLAALERLEKSP